MRIGWAINGGLDQDTGGYIYDRLIIGHLRASGHQVDVISLPRNDAAGVLNNTLDVLVIDELCYPHVGFFKQQIHCPIVLLVHHLQCWEPELAPIMRFKITCSENNALGMANHVISTSRYTAERLMARHGVPSVSVVEPGADRLHVTPRPAMASPFCRLLQVGTWCERKGQLKVLEALARLQLPHVTLSLVGDATRDPEYAAKVQHRIASVPFLRSHVHGLGQVSEGQLAHILAESDALVQASTLEGYGMAATEALNAGLAVLTTTAGAASQHLSRFSGVVLIEVTQARLIEDRLTDVLFRFACDATWRERIQQGAMAMHGRLPTWQFAGAAFEALLRNWVSRVDQIKRSPA